VKALYESDLQTIRSRSENLGLRSYLIQFTEILQNQCGSFLSPNALAYRFEGGFSEQHGYLGEFDGGQFVGTYGCDGIVASRLFGSVEKFFAQIL